VWWQLPPDPGGVGEAVVVRLPIEVIHPRVADEWTEPSHMVMHTEHVMPTSTISHRTNAWENANELAAIRLRWHVPSGQSMTRIGRALSRGSGQESVDVVVHLPDGSR
jgi:hypothetical protein